MNIFTKLKNVIPWLQTVAHETKRKKNCVNLKFKKKWKVIIIRSLKICQYKGETNGVSI